MTFDEWLKSVTPAGRVHIAPEDLRACWGASRREALEEAAARLEDRARGYITPDDGLADIVEGLEYGASVIRALAAEPKDPEDSCDWCGETHKDGDK